MSFPNVSKGLRIFFVAEILQLIAMVALAFISVGDPTAVAFVGALITLVIAIICGILEIVGLVKAGKEEPRFEAAWTMIIAMVLGQILLSLLNMFVFKDGSGNSTNIVITIFDTVSTIYVIRGISNCYERKGIQKDAKLMKVTTVLFLISLTIDIVLTLWTALVVSNLIVALVSVVVYLIANVLAYIFWLILIGRAIKAVQ